MGFVLESLDNQSSEQGERFHQQIKESVKNLEVYAKVQIDETIEML